MRQRDEEGFCRAFPELFTLAFRVAVRLLGQVAAAEDVAAEALARAYARWERIGGDERRSGWVVRVSTNLAIDALRKQRRVLQTELPRELENRELGLGDPATRIALVQALRALPPRQREVIALRHLAGLSEQEVASELRLAPGTVKTHLRRGLQSLGIALSERPGRDCVVP